MFFVFDSIPNQFITQEICNIIVFYILFNSKTERYKTQKMCDEAVDDCLAALEFIHDWLATSKMIKKLYAALYADDGLFFVDGDSGNVTSSCNKMAFLV